MNTPSNPRVPDRPSRVDPLIEARDNLRRAAMYQGIDVDEVERVVGAVVGELTARGRPPEAVVVAVKTLLSDSQASSAHGMAAMKAFRAARDSHDLYGAIVALAIAQYYGFRPHAADLTRRTDPNVVELSEGTTKPR